MPDVSLVLPSMQKCPLRHGPVQSRLLSPAVAPKRPAGQASGREAPSEHVDPRGHMMQPSSDARFVALENLPAGHTMAAGVPRVHCEGRKHA